MGILAPGWSEQEVGLGWEGQMGIASLLAGQRLRWQGKGKSREQRAPLSCQQGSLTSLSQSAAAGGGGTKGGKKWDIYQAPNHAPKWDKVLISFDTPNDPIK